MLGKEGAKAFSEFLEFNKSLKKLKSNGVIEEHGKGKYFVKPPSYLHEGTLDVNSQGNGYLISDEFADDVFIDADVC